MVKISVTFTRPSVSVPWHFEVVDLTDVNNLAGSPAFADKHQYKATEDMFAHAAGQTSLVSDVVWASQADFDAFKATPEYQAYVSARDAYNVANGITRSAETITTV